MPINTISIEVIKSDIFKNKILNDIKIIINRTYNMKKVDALYILNNFDKKHDRLYEDYSEYRNIHDDDNDILVEMHKFYRRYLELLRSLTYSEKVAYVNLLP